MITDFKIFLDLQSLVRTPLDRAVLFSSYCENDVYADMSHGVPRCLA